MWIILLFTCVSVILPNNAQEQTSFQAQTVTETSYSNNDANWDLTKPHVTIQTGRTDSADSSLTQNSTQHLIYSNEFIPLIMPFGFNRRRESDRYANENGRSADHLFLPTLLKRPEANNTVPYLYAHVSERNELSNKPVFYSQTPYFQPQSNFTPETLNSNTGQIYSEGLPNESLPSYAGFFENFDSYRNGQNVATPEISYHSQISQPYLNSNDRNFEVNAEPKPVPSSAEPEYANSESITSRTNDQVNKPFPNVDQLAEVDLPKPVNVYRNGEGYLPPLFPAHYYPYPFPLFQREGTFQPIVPYPSNNPTFDRESVPGFDDRIPKIPEKQVLTEDASDPIAENIPSATTTDILPPQLSPFPVRGYPYGLYSSPFVPPFVTNTPAYKLPFNTVALPQPTNVPRENIIVDDPRPPQIVPITPVPENFPAIFPQTDILPPEEKTSLLPEPQVDPEAAISDINPEVTKIPYEYGFEMSDGNGNDQHRKETSDILGVVTGSYGFSDNKGIYRFVTYIADKNGFRAFIKSNEPGVASSASADVVVEAERPPPSVIIEERKEAEDPFIIAPSLNADVIASGILTESK